MGLPLYIAPVESDISTKTAPKIASHGRSPIRRARSSRPTDSSREHRRRALAAAAAYQQAHSPLNTRRERVYEESANVPNTQRNDDDDRDLVRWYYPVRSGSDEPDAVAAASVEMDAQTHRSHEQMREILSGRNLDERVVSMFGQRWAELHARSIPSPPEPPAPAPAPSLPAAEPTSATSGRSVAWSAQEPSNGPSRSATSGGYSAWSSRARGAAMTEMERRYTAAASRRSRITRSPHPSGLSDRTDNELERARRSYMARRVAGSTPSHDDYEERIRDRISRNRRRQDRDRGTSIERLQEARFDGLGDRDRSLSPEGDGVWDTLLTTLTPDPQPPSVGSSFASGSAPMSAAASQSAGTGASGTPITEPDAVEEAFEPSACEGSDTENDDEEEEERNALTRIHNRSYASVVAAHSQDSDNSTSDEVLALLGGLGGMQRIVRNFARREDIPDEWWSEAGLSRTLAREESS